jgi:preprotein translocase subunit SecY
MIPLIFAVSILVFPGLIAQFLATSSNEVLKNFATALATYLSPNTLQYNILYFVLVVAFTYFYTMVIFQQQKISENLQRQGAFIPGVRPGRNTQLYLQRTLNRITLIGALFLGAVAVMPFSAAQLTGVNSLLLGATSLLIVVGVAIDTMRQLEAQLVMRNYEGFIK